MERPPGRFRCWVGLAFVLFGTWPETGRAGAIADRNVWAVLAVNGPLGLQNDPGRRWSYAFDTVHKFADAAEKLAQSTWRGALGYSLSAQWTVWAGYAQVDTDTPLTARPSREHRWHQQVVWSRQVGQFTLATRHRLEERLLSTGADCGLRSRHHMRASHPLPSQPALSGIVWNEVFFNLNSTDYGARHGFDQNRFFAGFGYKLGDVTRTEIGYLHNHIRRPGKEDRLNQTVWLSLLLSFK